MKITSLPFFTPLAKDYLSEYRTSPIREYFSSAPDAEHSELSRIIEVRQSRDQSVPNSHRAVVAEEIAALHGVLGEIGEAVAENLERLRSAECFAVVTGQQVGVFGGPLYTFYKTYTAILEARRLSKEFPDKHFVPVFWLETEDHDIEEVSAIHLINAESELTTVRYDARAKVGSRMISPRTHYQGEGEDEHASTRPTQSDIEPKLSWRQQIGPLPLNATALENAKSELRQAFAPTEYSEEVFALIDRCYGPDRSFGLAFAALLNEYFSSDGLLLLDANNAKLKQLAAPLFWKEIESSPQLSEKIVLQSVHVEEDYHAQVKPKALNLFYVESGERIGERTRLPIVERERSANQAAARTFFLKGTRKSFTLESLKEEVFNHTERFSPNVVFRPLYQDFLLPTVAYSAGPGEIAYFAQFRPGYEWAGIPMPRIVPRISATLIEERFERVIAKYHLDLEEILSEGRADSSVLLKSMLDSGVAESFESAITEIEEKLESLRTAVHAADGSLDGALTSLKGKIATTIREFGHKTEAAERKRHATTKAQLDKLLTSILPMNELQERELSLLYYLNKYGLGFISRLKSGLEPLLGMYSEHHLIHLLTMGAPTESDAAREKNDDEGKQKRTSDAAERLMAVADEES